MTKFKDGVYQKGRVMYDVYTNEPISSPAYHNWKYGDDPTGKRFANEQKCLKQESNFHITVDEDG